MSDSNQKSGSLLSGKITRIGEILIYSGCRRGVCITKQMLDRRQHYVWRLWRVQSGYRPSAVDIADATSSVVTLSDIDTIEPPLSSE